MEPGDSKSLHRPTGAQPRHRSGPGLVAYGGELISYEDEYVKLNSSLQLAWSESLEKDVFTNSTAYKKVEVLMLSWEPQFDDLKVQSEIDALKDVFETKFNFHVTRTCLERIEKRKTQNQINKIVADWVYEHDSKKTLLIVYFAGHGRPGKDGVLEIAGHKSPSDLRDYLDKVVWNRTEQCLLGLDSDVLQIFDCCFAGTIETRGSNPGASEFLAATGADATTPKPGKSSFTSALIWALKDLVATKRGFTTSDLSNKITEAPEFPPDQKPVLSKRGDSPFGEQQLIVLQPLRDDTLQSPTALLSNGSMQHEDSNHDVVTLKFVFAARPDESDIRKLGADMTHVVVRNGLKINRIVFGGIRPKQNDMVFKAISRFRAIGRKYSKGGTTSDAAADLIQNIEDEVEEHVLDRINDQKEEHLEGSRREFEAHSSTRRARERED